MSKEKQIIEIKECIDAVYGADCAYFDVDGFAIADEIYNAGYRKQEWISVDERLPEDGLSYEGFYPVDCLLAAKVGDRVVVDWGTRYVSFSYRTGKAEPYWEILHDWDEGQGCEITHWMPLPEPPKMKGGAE